MAWSSSQARAVQEPASVPSLRPEKLRAQSLLGLVQIGLKGPLPLTVSSPEPPDRPIVKSYSLFVAVQRKPCPGVCVSACPSVGFACFFV